MAELRLQHYVEYPAIPVGHSLVRPVSEVQFDRLLLSGRDSGFRLFMRQEYVAPNGEVLTGERRYVPTQSIESDNRNFIPHKSLEPRCFSFDKLLNDLPKINPKENSLAHEYKHKSMGLYWSEKLKSSKHKSDDKFRSPLQEALDESGDSIQEALDRVHNKFESKPRHSGFWSEEDWKALYTK